MTRELDVWQEGNEDPFTDKSEVLSEIWIKESFESDYE